MTKILVRSTMPFEQDVNASEILIYNMVGMNTGNLLYQRGVLRTVMTEDTDITTINTSKEYSEAEIDYFNENYDMFLIPLANALRVSFVKELERMTRLVKKLKIPCVVIGIGLQMDLNSNKTSFLFDEEADAFFKAVLEKSSCIGVRGEYTGEYMKRRGFVPEKEFTVIGCPSLYVFGDRLPEPRLKDLTPKSNISFNMKDSLPQKSYQFIRKEVEKFNDYTFISQVINEIQTLYVGYPHKFTGNRIQTPLKDYPVSLSDDFMRQGKMVGVLDADTWIEFLKTKDFNFGSRIHGNIASILAGTPCQIISSDSRVKELAEYHHLPHINYDQITEDMNIFNLYEKTDYSCLMMGHKERITHYLDFLDQNGVKRLSREELNGNDTPYDRYVRNKKKVKVITPFSTVSCEEQERRLLEYFSVLEEKYQKQNDLKKEKIKEGRENQKMLEKKVKKLERELEALKSSRFFKMKMIYDRIMGR